MSENACPPGRPPSLGSRLPLPPLQRGFSGALRVGVSIHEVARFEGRAQEPLGFGCQVPEQQEDKFLQSF